ncbi:MAG: hypothetical protein KIS94_07815 [Chitinophagales bacterium]|nr:hypothetical protein [Chitinophagales bacterium]
MKKITFILLLTSAFSVFAQVQKEDDITYTNNYFKVEEFKALSEKPAAIKYETNGTSVSFSHTDKAAHTYNVADLFPRSEYEHSIRNLSMSFNFTFEATSSPNDFFQLSFLAVPHQDFEYKDSVSILSIRIKANGTLYAEGGNTPYTDRICYSCPALAKDKTWGKVMAAEAPNMAAIPGFKQGAANKFSLTRTEDRWVLSINDNTVREIKGMSLGYLNSRQAPMITLSGKYTLKVENLQENYTHYNSSIMK